MPCGAAKHPLHDAQELRVLEPLVGGPTNPLGLWGRSHSSGLRSPNKRALILSCIRGVSLGIGNSVTYSPETRTRKSGQSTYCHLCEARRTHSWTCQSC